MGAKKKCTKMVFISKDAAESYIWKKRIKPGTSDSFTAKRSYKCKWCPHWHITSQEKYGPKK